jgi:hypothetical protein
MVDGGVYVVVQMIWPYHLMVVFGGSGLGVMMVVVATLQQRIVVVVWW